MNGWRAAVATGWFVAAMGCGPEEPSAVEQEGAELAGEPLVPNTPPPFHTRGHWIVDSAQHRVRLAGLNWVGFEGAGFVPQGLDKAKLETVVSTIRSMGFNVVRLPWSNQMWESTKTVTRGLAPYNCELEGMTPQALLHAVVAELTRQRLYVILDNHLNRAGSCCGAENTLWWDGFDWLPDHADFKKMNEQWTKDWLEVVEAYADNPYVIGVDLHNEPRGEACWGCGEPSRDWPRAAQKLGDAILKKNDRLLIFVEGIQSRAYKLQGVKEFHLELSVPHRLVYSTHDYGNGHYSRHPDGTCTAPGRELTSGNDKELFKLMHDQFGFVREAGKSYEAPLWIGEFGRQHLEVRDARGRPRLENKSCPDQDIWWKYFTEFVKEKRLDWTYFGATGPYYGVIDVDLPPTIEPGTTDTQVLPPYSKVLLEDLQGLER